MRALVTSAAMAALLIGSAQAADLPVYTEPVAPVAIAEPVLWSGFYAGVFGGYAWGDVEFEDNGLDNFCDDNDNDEDISACPGSINADVDGWLGGLFIGYNWNAGNFVFGVEGDLAYADIHGFEEDGDEDPADAIDAHIDALGTLRARVGYAFGNFLLFGTGGLAVAHVDYIAGDRNGDGGPDSDRFANFDDDEQVTLHGWEYGWTLGAGAEMAINNRWSVRADYLYIDLGEVDGEVHDDDFNDNLQEYVDEDGSFDTQLHTVRLGIAAHF